MILSNILFMTDENRLDLPRPFYLQWEEQHQRYYSFKENRKGQEHAIFHYCLSGRGQVRYRGETCDVLPGYGFLCAIDEADYFYPADGGEPWCFWWFGFKGGNYRELTHALVERFGAVFHLPEYDPFCRKVNDLKNKNKIILNEFDGAAMVNELLGALSRHKVHNLNKNMPQIIKETTLLIREMPEIPRIGELSGELGISREYLSRLFHTYMGVSLQKYLQQQSMKKAEDLLLKTDWPISEIAQKCGYYSTSSFIRIFNRYFNNSPSQYRSQMYQSFNSDVSS
ncbi:MAG: AraC family transcriptional regulator [Lentisphaerae bacterium]|nr:AraC family transcriptional regulator [Lentisphaerota bacterium]